jgi:hypothetical protein
MLGFRRGGIWDEEYDCDELSVVLVALAMERGASFPLAERGGGPAAGAGRGGVQFGMGRGRGHLNVRLRCVRGVRRVDVVLPAGATVAGDSEGSLGGDRAGQLSVELSETPLQLHATLKRT